MCRYINPENMLVSMAEKLKIRTNKNINNKSLEGT